MYISAYDVSLDDFSDGGEFLECPIRLISATDFRDFAILFKRPNGTAGYTQLHAFTDENDTKEPVEIEFVDSTENTVIFQKVFTGRRKQNVTVELHKVKLSRTTSLSICR